MMDELKEAIKSQMIDPRDIRDSWQLANELARLAVSGCAFPKASPQAYFEAIQALVLDGYLELKHGNQVNRKPVDTGAITMGATKQPKKKQDAPKHVTGSLFD